MSNKMRVKEIFSEAWSLVYGTKAAFAKLWLLYFLAIFLYEIVALLVFYILIFLHLPWLGLLLIIPGITIFFWGLIAIEMLGVRRALNMPLLIKSTLVETKRASRELIPLLLIYLVIAFICLFGIDFANKNGIIVMSILLYIVYIPLNYVFMLFAVPLVITKKCSFVYAITESCRKAIEFIIPLLLTQILLILCVALGALFTLGIGMIWIMPLIYIVNGIIFRNAFGLKKPEPFKLETPEPFKLETPATKL